MKILAGILHLGNINFRDIKKKDSEEIEEGCDISVLTIASMNETVIFNYASVLISSKMIFRYC